MHASECKVEGKRISSIFASACGSGQATSRILFHGAVHDFFVCNNITSIDCQSSDEAFKLYEALKLGRHFSDFILADLLPLCSLGI